MLQSCRSGYAACEQVLLFLLTILLSLQVFAADHKSTQKRIEELLANPDAAKAVWGIEVVDLGSGKTVYSLNADKLFIPASNTKLFTTAAVLALIGPEYRFRTTLESTGPWIDMADFPAT